MPIALRRIEAMPSESGSSAASSGQSCAVLIRPARFRSYTVSIKRIASALLTEEGASQRERTRHLLLAQRRPSSDAHAFAVTPRLPRLRYKSHEVPALIAATAYKEPPLTVRRYITRTTTRSRPNRRRTPRVQKAPACLFESNAFFMPTVPRQRNATAPTLKC